MSENARPAARGRSFNASEFFQKYTMSIALVVVTIVFSLWKGKEGLILLPSNVAALIAENAYVFILATGMLMCILTGGNIDLSVGYIVCFTAAIGCNMMVVGVNMWVAVLTMLLIGLAIGAFQGFWIAKVRVPAFIATLSGMYAFRGFTNVVLNEDDMTVWWEGMTKQPPKGHLRNWKGEVWDGSDGTRGAHPNSRFTAPAENCPCISEEFFKGTGVPISAIIFGGRRAKTAPLVYQSRDWAHGVFVGATMASETTAAATGAVGVVRRDPMAMRPFCGYNMADYWQHWLDMGEKLPNAPKIFNVNWFRTDDNGRFLWPGFGDNLRVLEWILKRCFDEVGADETVIGYEPKPEDINLDGSGVTVETLRALLTLDAESWRENCAGIREYFEQFGDKLPHELREELEALEKAFAE